MREKKVIALSNGHPKAWVHRHRYDIIKASRTGGFMAGFAGGSIGAMATGKPFALPLFTAGTMGGTFAGQAFGMKMVKELEKRLPANTRYRMPKLPSFGQVVTSPIYLPFKVGELYGKALIRRRAARAQPNPFILR